MDSGSAAFFAVCGSVIGWIGVWSFVGKVVRESNRNAPPGSRAKKAINAINIIQILPLLPLVPIMLAWMFGVKRPIERWYRGQRGRAEVVKMRRQWQVRRREWARDDLEAARAEKERLFRMSEGWDDEGYLELPSRTPKVTIGAGKSQFESLPAELRTEIYSYLDYGMALRVKAASRFLWNDNPEESIDQELRATYLFHADTFQTNCKAGRLACYTCLKLRDKREFSEDLRTGEFKRFGSQEIDRRCFDCQVIKGEVTWTRRLGRGWNRLEARVWNRTVKIFNRGKPS